MARKGMRVDFCDLSILDFCGFSDAKKFYREKRVCRTEFGKYMFIFWYSSMNSWLLTNGTCSKSCLL